MYKYVWQLAAWYTCSTVIGCMFSEASRWCYGIMNVHSIGMPESRRGISCISRGSYIFLGSRGNVAWLPIEIAWTRGDREEEGKGEGGGRRDMVFIAE